MKTLLRIDASIRTTASHTRTLTDYFEKTWLKANPTGTVIRRCLVENPIPHLSQEDFAQFNHVSADNNTLSDALILEIKQADHLLIGSPLYNLSLPSSLKAYFDHIVRHHETFEVTDGSYLGLLTQLSATLITTRGGMQSPDYQDDFQQDYLKAILRFIGVGHIDHIPVDATGHDQPAVKRSLDKAQQRIDTLLISHQTVKWLGNFSAAEKAEITTLRLAQAEAITNGDAAQYAALCTKDIQLLIPGHDAVSGHNDFLASENNLFASATFELFNKYPISIEKSGDLAVEIGRQEVKMAHRGNNEGVFSSHQKYTHVFRKTADGWRFAVLMSNPS